MTSIWKNKKGIKLQAYAVALFTFVLFAVGWYTVSYNSNNPDSFWGAYDYTPPSNNITKTFDKMNELSQKAEDLSCDINPEQESCKDRKSFPLADTLIGRMVQGSYGALITVYKLFSIPKQLIIDSLNIVGVPAIIITYAYNILLVAVVITIILIIFNRSDTA